MAKKKSVTPTAIKRVSCTGCMYNHPGDHPAVMWCDKIKMPMPKRESEACIHKLNSK